MEDGTAHCGHGEAPSQGNAHQRAKAAAGRAPIRSKNESEKGYVCKVRRESKHDAQEISIGVTFAPQGIGNLGVLGILEESSGVSSPPELNRVSLFYCNY